MTLTAMDSVCDAPGEQREPSVSAEGTEPSCSIHTWPGYRRHSIRALVLTPVRSIFIDERFQENHESPSLPRAATYGKDSDHRN
jgi:hypothetical protein